MKVGDKTYRTSDYTTDSLIKDLKKTSIDQLYNLDAINFRSAVSDDSALINEVISRWLLDNISKFNEIVMITRNDTYITDSHDGDVTESLNNGSNRLEDILAKKMLGRNYDNIGKVVDYQIPLKDIIDDRVGKIDMLSVNEEGNKPTINIIEFKRPQSKETMLRCVLEGLTYYKTVDFKRLKDDMKKVNLLANNPDDYEVVVSPLVFKDSQPYIEMQEITRGYRKNLKDLMTLISREIVPIIPYYLDGQDENSTCCKFG